MNSNDLVARQFSSCPSGWHRESNGDCERNSGWYWWGRWVLVGVLIVLVIITMIICSMNARRRRRRGIQPYYGTGWMAPGAYKYGGQNPNQGYAMNNYGQGGYQPTYPPQQQGGPEGGWVNPPPAYGQQQPQYTGSTFSPSDGYFGQAQQTGVQQPPHSYQREQVYSPPAGPPPMGKA